MSLRKVGMVHCKSVDQCLSTVQVSKKSSMVFEKLTKTTSLDVGTIDTNRIYHRFLMQKEKSKPVGKRIMPETRFAEFPALSVDPRVGISLSASETDV